MRNLYDAAQNGDIDVVKALIVAKADINQAKSSGVTPLHIAACFGHLDVVKVLHYKANK